MLRPALRILIMLWTGNSYFFAEYPRQLSTDINIENYKFKASFVSNKGPEKQNWYHSYDFYFNTRGKLSFI